MRIKRVARKDEFQMVRDIIFKGKEWSLEEVGLLSLILNLSTDLAMSLESIKRYTSDSSKTIERLISKLEEKGYIEVDG